MKKTILFLLCLGFVFSAQAQFTQGSSTQKSGSSKVAPEPYNKVILTYSPLTLKSIYKDNSNSESGYNAIAFTYMHGCPVAKIPFYVEFGLGAQYAFYSKDGYKTNVLSANIPVNFLYRFSFNGGNMHLAPYTGIYGRINAWGKSKYEDGDDSESVFDGDYGMKRFQLGWQIGAQFDVKKFYIQVAYLTDVTNVNKSKDSDYKTRMGGVQFGIGVLF